MLSVYYYIGVPPPPPPPPPVGIPIKKSPPASAPKTTPPPQKTPPPMSGGGLIGFDPSKIVLKKTGTVHLNNITCTLSTLDTHSNINDKLCLKFHQTLVRICIHVYRQISSMIQDVLLLLEKL